MAPSQPTPCSEFFSLMKKQGGISYKDMAKMILSGRPLSDGQSPVSRVNDRSWVSRFVVHAPVGSLQMGYFCSFSISAPRIVARLKSKKGRVFSSADILELICGDASQGVVDALAQCHQNVPLYRNTMYRIANEKGFTEDERAEIAMVLFVATACTGNVNKAVESALEFSKSVHGVGMSTPMITPDGGESTGREELRSSQLQTTIGLLRSVDGYVVGDTHWMDQRTGGVEIGAMALDANAINDVGVDVSAHHARVLQKDDGTWWIEDLGSTNGTFVIDGITGDEVRVSRKDDGTDQVEIRPGDTIRLGSSTAFVVVEGLPRL